MRNVVFLEESLFQALALGTQRAILNLMKTTAQGKQGSTAKTVYVHLTGIWISEVTHPSYATAWEVGWCDEGNAWRGPRVFIRVFESKREAWTYLASVTKNPNEGIVIPAEKKAA